MNYLKNQKRFQESESCQLMINFQSILIRITLIMMNGGPSQKSSDQ